MRLDEPAHWMPPVLIERERQVGWINFHPEDYCHLCGNRNMSWYVIREDWITATEAWAELTGREGICCPTCFAEMHEKATGERICWRLVREDAP